MLSFVYLEGNRKPHTSPDEHIAFTGTLTNKLQTSYRHLIPFKDHLTNYGRLYTNDGHFTIRRSGSYMISLRADPPENVFAIFDLSVNGRFTWRSYSKMGVASGQTISLVLKANDKLMVLSHLTHMFETGTLFSIAFLRS